eukprot:3843631-Rhodomonas_salina.2
MKVVWIVASRSKHSSMHSRKGRSLTPVCPAEMRFRLHCPSCRGPGLCQGSRCHLHRPAITASVSALREGTRPDQWTI